MTAALPFKAPELCVHKATGQAYVYVGGKRQYLGRHGKPQTLQKYHQLVAEIIASGGQVPVEKSSLRVKELVARFWVWAEGYYLKADRTPTQELDNFRQALRPLKELYADTPVSSFGPRALMAVRQKMIELGWCRGNINKNIGRIKTMMRWGTEQELIPGNIFHAVQAVSGLKRGRSPAREAEPVGPVPLHDVHAIQPFVSKQVWALVQLQMFTAARAGELVRMRAGEIDRSGKVWVYTPAEHKTAHHGHKRTIYFGPKAKEVLGEFLLRPDGQFLFCPAEAEKQRREVAHENRTTDMSCGNRPGTNCSDNPRRPPGESYTVASYRRAIARACDQAFPAPEPLAQRDDETAQEWRERLTADQSKALAVWRRSHRWHPHQLRHTAATELRKEFGLEAARVVLGHRSAAVTELYAEIDHAKAVEAMLKVG